MNNREAIEQLSYIDSEAYSYLTESQCEALHFAIKALEETDIDWQSEMAKDYGVRQDKTIITNNVQAPVYTVTSNTFVEGASMQTEVKGDLISREALKEEFKARCICNCDRCKYQKGAYCGLIDNAPTVEVPEEVNCVLTMFGKCSYNETGCSDCEIKNKIRKALNANTHLKEDS